MHKFGKELLATALLAVLLFIKPSLVEATSLQQLPQTGEEIAKTGLVAGGIILLIAVVIIYFRQKKK